jgi:hypothetical protein
MLFWAPAEDFTTMGVSVKHTQLIFAFVGVFAMVFAADSSALAGCRVGTGSLLNGNYAIRIGGAETDTGTPATGDPQPVPIAAIGVIHADGNCDITGGELIENDGGVFTSPTVDTDGTDLGVPAFSGSLSANLTGSYFFANDNLGVLTLIDSTSSSMGTVSFFIAIERGNAEFRGARSSAGDPLSILGEKQATVTSTQFYQSFSFLCEGVALGPSTFGLGYDTMAGTWEANLDPETNTTIEAGGTLFLNLNNGYIQSPKLGNEGFGIIPSGGFACPFAGSPFLNSVVLGTPSVADGTENTSLLNMFNIFAGGSCSPGTPNQFGPEISWVLWGSANQSAFMLPTGGFTDFGQNFAGVSVCSAGAKVVAGRNTLVPGSIDLIATRSNLHPSKTLLLTNGTGKPLDYTSITGSGPAFTSGAVTISSAANAVFGTTAYPACLTAPANNQISLVSINPFSPLPYAGQGGNPCEITLINSGTSCIGSPQTGTLTINANDNVIIGGTQTTAGDTVPVTCGD